MNSGSFLYSCDYLEVSWAYELRTIVSVATRGAIKEICNIFCVSLLICNVQMELFQICRPLLMVIIMQLPLGLYKMERSVICVGDHLLPRNVMFPLPEILHDRIHLFIIGGVFLKYIKECLTMIGHQIPLIGENWKNIIVRGIFLNFKFLLQVWQCDYWCRSKAVLQLSEYLLFGLGRGNFFFLSTPGNLTQRLSDMRESQHKPMIKNWQG